MGTAIRVPLAVDAQVRVPLGPAAIPLRGLAVVTAAAPLAYLALESSWLTGGSRFGVAAGVLTLAFALSAPTLEGIWIGTYGLYRLIQCIFPSAVINGEAHRAHLRSIGGVVHIHRLRPAYTSRHRRLRLVNHLVGIPRLRILSPGLIELAPGGARAILEVDGPTAGVGSDAYLQWCERFMAWIMAVECPAQILTLMSHHDSQKVQLAFDRRTSSWPRTLLRDMERELAGTVADISAELRQFVVFAPGQAGRDGVPRAARLTRAADVAETTAITAERVLESAVRHAQGFGLAVRVPDRDDLKVLVTHAISGASTAVVGAGTHQINDQHHVLMTVTKLPPRIEAGSVVDALMRARARGIASLHIFPVDATLGRKAVKRQVSLHQYASRQGTGDIDSEVAVADAQSVLAAMARREVHACRVALTFSVCHNERVQAEQAAQRLSALLVADGFEMVAPTTPGILPALALSPGSPPLMRSLQLTTDSVVTRMLPALGTPFSNPTHPLIGVNALTGAPAYLSVWSRPNHNMVIVGSSGAGKSVSTKTLLVRHVMEGVSAVVIDPDSEYRPVLDSLGGAYFELGTDALNPLAAGARTPPDTAASLLVPILSVMAGDEKGIRDGRPIRRLSDEDQGWIHAHVADFYRSQQADADGAEPLMRDLVDYLKSVAQARALTPREQERCRIITSRLARFTQGQRARVFDRPSTFSVGRRPVGIGLRNFAMSYGADLTPALAVILTNVLAAIARRDGHMIVVVDEAHRITCDPDAGEVLGQLVRQARKYGAGVWMASQKVEDFVGTDMGRTLAATAATKLVLGSEEAVIDDVAQVFRLQSDELKSINPMVQGRGILVSGGERTVVHVVTGPAIMALADTSSAIREAAECAS